MSRCQGLCDSGSDCSSPQGQRWPPQDHQALNTGPGIPSACFSDGTVPGSRWFEDGRVQLGYNGSLAITFTHVQICP